MQIILADSYGFCFGVERAVLGAYEAHSKNPVATLGAITHNKTVLGELANAGIEYINDISELQDFGKTLLIRAHGVAPKIYNELDEKGIKYIDYTCPCVFANQKQAQKAYKQGKKIILTGEKTHPEMIGLNGWIDDCAIFINNVDEVKNLKFDENGEYFLMSQTTFSADSFEVIARELKQKINNLTIQNTICKDTQNKQNAARKLAKSVDKMIVLGDKSSSNSKKLYEISKKYQKNTYFVENIFQIDLNNFLINDKIGIIGGASTPPSIIKEAVLIMDEHEKTLQEETGEKTFAEMLDSSILTLHTGMVVKGTVISIVNGEVLVNLGYKSDGVIPKAEFSANSEDTPSEVVAVGDDIYVYVLRVNDGEGNVLLSRKRAESASNMLKLEASFKAKTPVKGKITEIIKGGTNVTLDGGVLAFLPASQASNRFVSDLNELSGQEFDFDILTFDKKRQRIVVGRRDLARAEEKAKRKEFLHSLKVGEKVSGKVSSITSFGAFVNLGGIDGLIHVTNLSWNRIRHANQLLKEGDEVEVWVDNIDYEKGKIGLSLKDIHKNPWADIETKYPVGSVATGTVVRMTEFGAFINLDEGLDALIHISQLSDKRVTNPNEVLEIGQVVDAKVLKCSGVDKKISLSIKPAAMNDNFEYDYEEEYEYEDEYEEETDEIEAIDGEENAENS